MSTLMRLAAISAFAVGIWSSESAARELKWRDGESRQTGFGRCAKGPCMKRTNWSVTRPHRHVGSKVLCARKH